MNETVIHWITHYGYAGLFSLLMVGIVGLPVPDEMLLTFVGYLSSRGDLELLPAIAAAFSGSACGITLNYVIGRTGGAYVIERYGGFLHLTPEKLSLVHDWFDQTGKWGLMIGYFLPGVRHLAPLAAGASKLKYPVFALFAYTGGIVWSATLIMTGYFLGKEWAGLSREIHHGLLSALAISGGLASVYYLWRRFKRRHRK